MPAAGGGDEHGPSDTIEVRVIGSPPRGIVLAGELDMAQAEGVERVAGDAVAASGPEAFVLDLRGLTFVDSFGVRALLNVASRARDARRAMRVIVGDSPVRRALELFSAWEVMGRLE